MPCMILSRIEFQPQCVKNPPVEPWLRTSACGAHDGTTRPCPLALSSKPSGRKARGFSWLWSLRYAALANSLFGLLATNKNFCPLNSNPKASSLSWEWDRVPPLPKHTNRTEPLGWSSNQLKHCSPSTYWNIIWMIKFLITYFSYPCNWLSNSCDFFFFFFFLSFLF